MATDIAAARGFLRRGSGYVQRSKWQLGLKESIIKLFLAGSCALYPRHVLPPESASQFAPVETHRVPPMGGRIGTAAFDGRAGLSPFPPVSARFHRCGAGWTLWKSRLARFDRIG